MKKFIIIAISAIVVIAGLFSCGGSSADSTETAKVSREQFVKDSLARREKEIADSIATAKHLEEVKGSVRLTSYYLSKPNSAGGCDVHFNYQNLSKEKTIKYLYFTVSFYNAVGDLVSCDIRDSSKASCRDTGPVKPMGYSSSGYWDCIIYNYQASKMVLESISIEYMDGTTLDIEKDELPLLKGYKG